MRTALVAVAGGTIYEEYAARMMESAAEFFHPTGEVDLIVIPGDSGWPNGTMMRWHHLLDNLPRANFVFMIDCDMEFVAPVWGEVLPTGRHGITATQHPGYPWFDRALLPYDRNPESEACVQPDEGEHYFCGGFVGGERTAMRILGTTIMHAVDVTLVAGHRPLWHDESCLNRALIDSPPRTVLTPSYCYPARDDHYRQNVWGQEYERKIVAIDKTAEERGER